MKVNGQTQVVAPTAGLIPQKSGNDMDTELRNQLDGSPPSSTGNDAVEFGNAYRVLKDQIGKK